MMIAYGSIFFQNYYFNLQCNRCSHILNELRLPNKRHLAAINKKILLSSKVLSLLGVQYINTLEFIRNIKKLHF